MAWRRGFALSSKDRRLWIYMSLGTILAGLPTHNSFSSTSFVTALTVPMVWLCASDVGYIVLMESKVLLCDARLVCTRLRADRIDSLP